MQIMTHLENYCAKCQKMEELEKEFVESVV